MDILVGTDLNKLFNICKMKLSNKLASLLLILLFSPFTSFSQIDPLFNNVSEDELKIIGVTTNPKKKS